MNTETWQQRRDRLAEEAVCFVSPIDKDIAPLIYKAGYTKGRADLLEDVLEKVDAVDGWDDFEKLVKLLKSWRKKTE